MEKRSTVRLQVSVNSRDVSIRRRVDHLHKLHANSIAFVFGSILVLDPDSQGSPSLMGGRELSETQTKLAGDISSPVKTLEVAGTLMLSASALLHGPLHART